MVAVFVRPRTHLLTGIEADFNDKNKADETIVW